MNQPPRHAVGAPRELPSELRAALASSPAALAAFDRLSPSHRREYVQWVDEARRPDSRERRAAQTVMRLLSGGDPSVERADD